MPVIPTIVPTKVEGPPGAQQHPAGNRIVNPQTRGSSQGPERRSALTRRSLLIGGGAALTGSMLDRHGHLLAQGLTGSITIGYENTQPAVGKYAEIAAQAIMATNPSATIEVIASNAPDYLGQIALQLIMGKAPDVFMLIGLGSGELATAGFVQPLDEYLTNWGDWNQYDVVARDGVSFDDRHWSIPWGLNLYFLFYRKDLFEAAGLPTEWQPRTRQDIIETAQIVKESNPNIIPFSLYAGANAELATAADFMALVLSSGGTLTDDENRWYIDSCPIRETLGFYETAFRQSKVIPVSVLSDVDPLRTIPDAFGDGELAILHEQIQHYSIWTTQGPANADMIGIARLPGVDGPFVLGDVGGAWYINNRSKNPDLGWAFIEAFNTAEIQAALCADDPHLPTRLDARQLDRWLDQPLAQHMLDAAEDIGTPPPEPQFRKLIEVVQNATGLVATGEATPDEAISRYGEHLTRTMGEANVVSEPCP